MQCSRCSACPRSLLALTLAHACCTDCSVPASDVAADWRNRTIYQVLIDRFAAPKAQYSYGTEVACNISERNYCGGTFASLAGQLDYIRGLNFGAVWISPTVVNTPAGYHGYWCACSPVPCGV
jgi:alpha-amylase